MRTEMRCSLDDRDELNERGFKKEKEGSYSKSELKVIEEDEDMIDEDEDDEEDEDGDAEDEGKNENKIEEYGDEDKDDLEGGEEEDEGVWAATPFEAYVDDEVADEMDEYGYSGLDQVINEDVENQEIEDDENAFGPEDEGGCDERVQRNPNLSPRTVTTFAHGTSIFYALANRQYYITSSDGTPFIHL